MLYYAAFELTLAEMSSPHKALWETERPISAFQDTLSVAPRPQQGPPPYVHTHTHTHICQSCLFVIHAQLCTDCVSTLFLRFYVTALDGCLFVASSDLLVLPPPLPSGMASPPPPPSTRRPPNAWEGHFV